jgi:regulator of protease activity HflC (stomatin/prohibitin superfamily)
MFDKLIDFLLNLKDELIPVVIVSEWMGGIHMRGGKFLRIIKPGIRFKIPFIDHIWTSYVITQTVHLQPQTLTTQDEKNIVLKSIIRYHVYDVKKFLMSVNHAADVLVDTTQGVIRDIVERTDWYDLVDVNDVITDEVKLLAKDWGIEVERVTLTDLGIIRTYRLMSDIQNPIKN